jgi:DNA modification methylase
MKTETIKLSKLKANPSNPRVLRDEKFAKLKKSIQDFPDMLNYRAIVAVTDKDGKLMVLGGNMRLRALQELGMKEAPVMLADHWTEEQRREFIIKDNVGFGEWDWDALGNEWDAGQLTEWGLDVPEDFAEEKADVVEDEVPEPPVDPITKPGDLWMLGDHRLLCGDSTKAEDVERLMAGAKADMIHTDPPYGMSFQSNMRTKSKQFDELENDDKILTGWIAPAIGVSSGWVFVWTTWKVLEQWLPVVREFGKMTNLVVWSKGGGGIGDLKGTFATDHEMAMVFNRGAEICGKRIGSVWSFGKDAAASYMHPTQKPVALAGEAIDKTTHAADLVYDPFLGSGTTLIAAEQLGRKCYGMEISPQYCDVIVKRWETLTGKKAIHQATGKTFNEMAETGTKQGTDADAA